MKLNKLKLKNFYKFTDFEIVFNGRITKLVGMNGAGKSSILIALWAGLKGIAERAKSGQLVGERYRFIGNNGKSADIEIEFVDEEKKITVTAKNHITAANNQISFTSSDGATIDEGWLKNFFNVAFLSAKHFTELSSKEQALALGIDTGSYDKDIAEVKAEYTLINRDLTNLGTIEEVEKVEPIDISKLMKEREEREEFNNEQRKYKEVIEIRESNITDAVGEIETLESTIAEAQNKIKELNGRMKQERSIIDKLPQPKKILPFDDIDHWLKNSQTTNNKAKDYQDYLKKVKKFDEIKEKLEDNRHTQGVKVMGRIEYIKQKKLPFSDLSIDEKGGLLLKDRPIKAPYFSKGEFEVIVAKLYESLFCNDNDVLKTRFIDDFELLDEDNQKLITNGLLKEGFQIITAEVGNKSKENSILLRECKIVKDESEEPKIF